MRLWPWGKSNPRKRDLELRLILPFLVFVRGAARLVALEEEHLRDAFVRVDLRRNRRRVGDLERRRSFPFGLEWRHVDDDAAAGIRRLAKTHGEDIARDAEVLDRSGQRERVRRHDTDSRLE